MERTLHYSFYQGSQCILSKRAERGRFIWRYFQWQDAQALFLPRVLNFKVFIFSTVYNIVVSIQKRRKSEKEKRADSKKVQPHTQKRKFSESEQI